MTVCRHARAPWGVCCGRGSDRRRSTLPCTEARYFSLMSPTLSNATEHVRLNRGESRRLGPDSAPGLDEGRTLSWIGPFVVFMLWLAVDKYLPVANPSKEILRDTVLVLAIVGFSRRVLPTRAPHWMASIALGLAVFAMWVAPDVLIAG